MLGTGTFFVTLGRAETEGGTHGSAEILLVVVLVLGFFYVMGYYRWNRV